MIAYVNTKTNYGVETVDQLDTNDFQTFKEFKQELKRLLTEYRTAGINVYRSQRCDRTWNS